MKHIDFEGTEEEFVTLENNRIKIMTIFGYCGVAGCKANETQEKTREGNIMVNTGTFGSPNPSEQRSNFIRGLVCDEHFKHQDMILVKFSK